MRLQTFLASDMDAALAEMRKELGEHAVILGSTVAKDGSVVLRAAVEDYPCVAARIKRPAEAGPQLYHERLVARLRPAASPEHAHNGFDRAELLAVLHRNRLAEGCAPRLAEDAEKSGLGDLTMALAAALDKHMRLSPIAFGIPGAFLLAGLHGAGKTTVAAKLGAHARMAGCAVRLAATDLDGAGQLQRLEMLAAHIDAAVLPIRGPAELAEAAKRAEQDGAVLIADTAGFDPRAPQEWREFLGFAEAADIEILGVVSAAMDADEARDLATALGQLGAERAIVTGLDCARRKGALVALALSDLAIAQVTRSPFLAEGVEALMPLHLAQALIAGGDALRYAQVA